MTQTLSAITKEPCTVLVICAINLVDTVKRHKQDSASDVYNSKSSGKHVEKVE